MGIIEELALDFEERYERAIRNGFDPDEVWSRIRSQSEWHELAHDFRALFVMRSPRSRVP